VAGRRYKDFRSGDLNEELGILLLKGVAAVAPVTRPEDVGIDAVATLLREGPGDFLTAENPFYVQFKSSSTKIVKYQEHEVRWLEGLKLPFFIGSVRKAESVIDLYAAHRLSQVLLEKKYKTIELFLDPENKTYLGIDPNTEEITDERRRVNIGPPLLTWSTQDFAKPEFLRDASICLKQYLDAEQKNIDFRGIRYLDIIRWETGKPPWCNQGGMHYQNICQDEILNVFRSMTPHITALSLQAWMTNDRSAMELVVQLIDYMRRTGFDPDPNGIYHSKLANWDQLAIPIDVLQKGNEDPKSA